MTLPLADPLMDQHGGKLEIRRIVRPTVAGIHLEEPRAEGLLDNPQNLPRCGAA